MEAGPTPRAREDGFPDRGRADQAVSGLLRGGDGCALLPLRACVRLSGLRAAGRYLSRLQGCGEEGCEGADDCLRKGDGTTKQQERRTSYCTILLTGEADHMAEDMVAWCFSQIKGDTLTATSAL